MLPGFSRNVAKLAGRLLGELSRFTPLRRWVYRVHGSSMLPTLREGDYVIIRPLAGQRPQIGDLVVAQDPGVPQRVVIKRVASLGTETVSLSSDNPVEGRDSRHFGSVPNHLVLGRVARVWSAA